MRRKHKTYLFVLLCTPFAFAIPTLFNVYFPKQLIAFTKIFYLFPLLAVIGCTIALTKTKNLSTAFKKQLRIKQALNPLKMIVLILLLLCALFGQAGIFIQHAVAQGQLDAVTKSKYLLDLMHQFGWQSLLWPWALLGITSLSFVVRSQQHQYQPFSQWLPRFPPSTLYRLLRKGLDGYIEMCTRIFICLLLGIFLASLCLVMSNMHIRPIVGVLSFVFLLLMVYSKRFTTLENNIPAYRVSPTAIFACILIFMFFITMIVKLMITVLIKHAGPEQTADLMNHQTPLILHTQTWLMSWHLWMWSWWIIATPLTASVIAKFTQSKKSFLTVFYLLLFGAIIATTLQLTPAYVHLYLAEKLLNPTSSLLLQSIAILGIFALFAKLNTHHIIWLGFLPDKTPKKLRVMRLRIVWALIAMGFGSMLLSGLQSILLIQMLVAIVASVILILMIRW